MPIKRSAGHEIQALIAELNSDDEVRRESAVARLAVIGTRAVDRLVALLAEPAPPLVVASALHALESIADARALAPALSLVVSPDPLVSGAAVGVARRFLHHESHGDLVLEQLVQIALDTTRPHQTRLAALDALNDVGKRVLAPVWERLKDDPDIAVRQRAAKATGQADPLMEVEAAASGVLPENPAALERLIEVTASTVPLSTLHRLIEVLRAREDDERSRDREGWRSVRGAVHAALARRDSRVALYDLRETFQKTGGALPGSFVTAIEVIGDREALEAIAAAYAGSLEASDSEWLIKLKAAFETISKREHIGSRHAVIKRIETKWPDAARDLLSTISRSTRASKPSART